MKKRIVGIVLILLLCAPLAACHKAPAPQETPTPLPTETAAETPAVTPAPTATLEPVTDEVNYNQRYNEPDKAKKEDIIGTLEIRGKKMPVMKNATDAMLKVGVGRLAGYGLNDPGTVLLIGHNYASGAQFGVIRSMKKGERVKLTDLKKRTMTYEVYDIMILNPDETKKTDNDLPQALVLISCTSGGKQRRVLMCKLVED